MFKKQSVATSPVKLPQNEAIVALDPQQVDKLEADIEHNKQHHSAYEIICHILCMNITRYDIEKLRKSRANKLQKVLSEISASNMNHSIEISTFYEKVNRILKK